jgi:hypothetical protein
MLQQGDREQECTMSYETEIPGDDIAKRANQAYRADILKDASDSERLELIQGIDEMRAMLVHCAEIFDAQSRTWDIKDERKRAFFAGKAKEICEMLEYKAEGK